MLKSFHFKVVIVEDGASESLQTKFSNLARSIHSQETCGRVTKQIALQHLKVETTEQLSSF